MTRINLGVDPEELCDQHLVAEYRELPRVFAYIGQPNLPLGAFRLGKGHVLWCARYPGTMVHRYHSLVREMRYRGFSVNYPEPRTRNATATKRAPDYRVTPDQAALARDLIVERIRARLDAMRGTPRGAPRWTRRTAPTWAQPPKKGDPVVVVRVWGDASSPSDGAMGAYLGEDSASGQTWVELSPGDSWPVRRARNPTPEELTAHWLAQGGTP